MSSSVPRREVPWIWRHEVAYLFDTDAISELFRKRPSPAYTKWLSTIARADQFTSAIVVGELFKGAFRSPDRERHLENIRSRVLPAVSVLPFDVAVSETFGELAAQLADAGTPLADADLQIASTALQHGLELVTGNIRHFEQIPGLHISRVLADSRL